jgi:hypothetical protein
MTNATGYSVTDATGLPETKLPDPLLAQLPESVAAAPWHTRDCQVVTWLHQVDAAAAMLLPSPIRPTGGGLIAWALVRYGDTPVGPYSEIAATWLSEDPDGYGHVPFIVVDSLASIVGGRVNWLLPKALARFDWSDDGLAVRAHSDQPADPRWAIAVSVEPTGEPQPVSVPNHLQQVSADGGVRRFDGELTGAMRPAAVTVEGSASGLLSALFAPGRYDGTMIGDGEFKVEPLRGD